MTTLQFKNFLFKTLLYYTFFNCHWWLVSSRFVNLRHYFAKVYCTFLNPHRKVTFRLGRLYWKVLYWIVTRGSLDMCSSKVLQSKVLNRRWLFSRQYFAIFYTFLNYHRQLFYSRLFYSDITLHGFTDVATGNFFIQDFTTHF